jgi:prepilin-type N-terminal cleavage/methylation domain-containing protein
MRIAQPADSMSLNQQRPPTKGTDMYDRLRNRLDAGRQDGFTLIELLIVIVILGVLAGIVVFAVGGITDRGTTSACKADKKTLEVAQEAHYAKEGKYATEQGLVDANLMRDLSTMHDTSTSGAVTVQSGGGCT